jgi:hypothetical protein
MVERVRLEPKRSSKPGTFKKGTPRPAGAGRQPGQPNRTTRILKEAILEAAALVGQDKRGKDGLIGYMKRIAIAYPEEFCALLGKVLPMQLTGLDDGPVKMELTAIELKQKMIERGLPISGVFDGPAEILLPAKVVNGNGHANGHGQH